ncbi:MAG TPA: hypothetical protein VG934_02890 [Candidatus Paceibacterota bacterium]|nr:hypothetical protein [Candidatus Paceibacterota bacterium]
MTQKYKDYREQGGLDHGCPLCEAEPLKKYTYWKITDNKFPFDRIAQRHEMLLPLRHTNELGLTEEEKSELLAIKHSDDIQGSYQFMIEATEKQKSIPGHFHIHLLVAKDFDDK